MTGSSRSLVAILKPMLKFALIAIVIAGGVYWFQFSPLLVASHEVSTGNLIGEVMGTGTLEARMSATVSPKISGRIAELLADQGDTVRAGDLLVRLDDVELQQQVAIAEANVEAAAAAIARLGSDKTRAEAVYQQAQKSSERIAALVQQNAISRDEVDKAAEALAVAEAGVSRAEAAITEGQKQLVSAQKTLQYHQARLLDTQIMAPFDGLIVRRSREPGDIAVPGSSILTLISTDELWVSAWVDETEMASLQNEQAARVVFRSSPQRAFAGSVARLGREADRETREFIVDVRVLELPNNWAVGQRAEVFIKVAEALDALLIPADQIVHRAGVDGVFVLEGTHAQWRPIKIGLRSRANATVEVLDGLKAGEVVIKPVQETVSLRDGRRVTSR